MLGTGDTTPLQIAVIDTDSGFLQVLGKRMDAAGWQYRITGGSIPPEALVQMRVNALVVDLGVLGPRAWDYLQSVCERLPGLGIVVCTGRSTVAQRVRGLRMGADDWLTKPCHPEELLARVEAVVRRRRSQGDGSSAKPDVITAGELEVKPDQFQAFVAGRSVELTRREFELIQLLASVEGQVLQREDIYERVWGYAMAHGDRSVDVFVRKLRSKLDKASPAWRYIHTHFGVGYRFAAEPVEAGDAADAGTTTEPTVAEIVAAPQHESVPA